VREHSDADAARRNDPYGTYANDYGVFSVPGLIGALPRDASAAFRILEIGCCYGHSSAAVKAAYPNAEVVAGDIVAECLVKTKELYPTLETALINADRELPFADGEFDYVFSSNLFEHLYDDAAHLAEVRRILKRGGEYVISTPNLWIELLYWGLINPEQKTRFRSIWTRLTGSREISHCNLQTVSSLRRRFSRAGFAPRVQRRDDLSNTEQRKLAGTLEWLPQAAREPAFEVARNLWRNLPPFIQPSIVVIGKRP